ncbi:uncharacterized protein LOC130779371 isoform X2 [Actinidia eriantha]|uniref:uncharacterized protein LOC130779371 isoform X2 n=1 Tax=Actinidia eriantha TaxID=165200 RepID=UPI002587FCCD|nr:uncharacterized protein LOC130779371 isoform X2 [Actinidia eriantha]
MTETRATRRLQPLVWTNKSKNPSSRDLLQQRLCPFQVIKTKFQIHELLALRSGEYYRPIQKLYQIPTEITSPIVRHSSIAADINCPSSIGLFSNSGATRSSVDTFYGILRQALGIPPPEALATGYMILPAPLHLSLSHPHTNHTLKTHVGLMLLSEVSLGEVYELKLPKYMSRPPQGKHSTEGLGTTIP